ncbi:MFS general substrate transporter [Lanmaoa asiatica]|nr:MFS general substrate transporter [Lanmaoa asiatica]
MHLPTKPEVSCEVKGVIPENPINSLEDGDEALRLVGAQERQHFSDEYNRKLKRKLDFFIPTIAALVYFTQFLDKTSLNYARFELVCIQLILAIEMHWASIMGFPITGQVMWIMARYITWEFPTVYIAQKLPLAKYLCANIFIWGIVLICHANANSFGAIFVLRFILGMCESCVAPILILVISMFYKKNEQVGCYILDDTGLTENKATRIAYFYMMLGFTQVFGGFISYGISFYGGTALRGYQIVYYLLGGLAILVGLVVLLWFPDSPVTWRMLTEEQRIACLERVRDDQGGIANKKFKKDQVMEALLDVRTWLIVLATMLTDIPSGGLTNFSNIIIKNFGYTSKQTLILATPAGIVEVFSVVICGWYSDRKGERMLPVIWATIPTIAGMALLIGFNETNQKGVLLFGTYLIGTFGSTLSVIYAYNASNTSGYTKKLTINAITLTFFSVGNIIGTEIFQPSDAPAYIPGKTAIMVLLTMQMGVAYLLRYINIGLNRKKLKALAELKAAKGWTDEMLQQEAERHAFADLTDKQYVIVRTIVTAALKNKRNAFFIYTI